MADLVVCGGKGGGGGGGWRGGEGGGAGRAEGRGGAGGGGGNIWGGSPNKYPEMSKLGALTSSAVQRSQNKRSSPFGTFPKMPNQQTKRLKVDSLWAREL